MIATWINLAARLTGCVVCLTIAAGASGQETASAFPVTLLPEIAELPNPFLLSNGSRVHTRADWDRRRTEIRQLFERYQYGTLPPKPEKMTVRLTEPVVDEAAGASVQRGELRLEYHGKLLILNVRITTPIAAAERTAPYPVIVQGGFFGLRGPPGGSRPPSNNEGKGGASRRPSRSKIYMDRGYALAELNLNDVAADSKDRARESGVYQLFNEHIDCGGLMAWAWGLHRVIDLIETMPDKFDASKVVVTGHSRYGKAALIAGAFDDRIALTVPSHSGCAGAAPYRFIYGESEQLHNITGFAPQWFRPDFSQFVDNVNRLPVDQHMLHALVAPRALLAIEGTNDAWTNPQGSQLTCQAGKTVYDFLGAGNRISMRFRAVGHTPSNEDLLEFADHIFFNKPLSEEFGKLAYEPDPAGWSWIAPIPLTDHSPPE